MVGTDSEARLNAPETGEHIEEIPLEFGMTWEDITALKNDGYLIAKG